MREFCQGAIEILKRCPESTWAEFFVMYRLQFARQYGHGLVFSTSHGADFFQNVIDLLDGKPWNEAGELGNNFRKLLTHSQPVIQP